MQTLLTIKPGDSVEIIAPASRCTDKALADLKALLTSWQLNCIVDENIFGKDILCANTDEMRFHLLKNALLRPETKAVICARGGYGSMRLIPELVKVKQPSNAKLFVGMSDITALHLFLQQQWQWPVLHAALSQDKFTAESIAAVKSVLFGETKKIAFQGIPLNASAEKNHEIDAIITGGNLCILQTSIGTDWQIDAKDKIIFIEEVGERGYRVDRMLQQLRQANLLKKVKAIILGDFTKSEEANGTSLVKPVLERFAKECNIPVVQITGVGHGATNFPLALGVKANLCLGKIPCLTIIRKYN